jgi:hypothetical protein
VVQIWFLFDLAEIAAKENRDFFCRFSGLSLRHQILYNDKYQRSQENTIKTPPVVMSIFICTATGTNASGCRVINSPSTYQAS